MVTPLLAGLGTPEILIILVVVVLLFGAKKLPELARGSGQALRIFKSETKGLLDEDEKKKHDLATKSEAEIELEKREAEMKLAQERVAQERLAREQQGRTEPGA